MQQAAIDFVIAWVDGGNEAWNAQKEEYLNMPQQRKAAEYGIIDAGESRYRDWNMLHYWFRAVEKYAPWVNRVHFITDEQVPRWLNTEHPKLHIVKHRDYMPAEYLPTFSSHPIELNMHRIEGLAEQFVYFNDDFFLTAPVKPEDFFVNGLPCDSLMESPVSCDNSEIWNYVRVNDTAFINRHFCRAQLKKQQLSRWFSLKCPRALVKNLVMSFERRSTFFGLHIHHLPQPYLKSVLQEVWELEPQLLHETSMHKFRDIRDVSQYIFKHYQQLSWKFHPYSVERSGHAFCGLWDPAQAAQAIETGKYKMICLNDGPQLDYEAAKSAVLGAFEKTLPQPSAFEKPL